MFYTAKEYLDRIEAHWRSSASGVLKTAAIILEAEDLVPMQLQIFEEQLGLDAKGLQRLKRIGRCKRLYVDGVVDKLPSSYATLVEITRLSDQQFNKGLAKGEINPNATLAQIKAFRLGKKKVDESDKFPSTRKFLTIRLDDKCEDTDVMTALLKSVEEVVNQISQKFKLAGIAIQDHGLIERLHTAHEKALSSEWKNREKEIVQLVRRYLSRKRREQLDPLKNLPSNIRSGIAKSYKRDRVIFDDEVYEIDSIEDIEQYKCEIGLDDWDFNRMTYDEDEFLRFKRVHNLA